VPEGRPAELLISASAEASNNLPQLTTLKITTLNHSSCDAGLPFWTDRLLGALMHDATSQFSHFRLAIAPGVPSSCLNASCPAARGGAEVTIAFFETSADDLLTGLEEGRYDAGMSLRNAGAPAVKSQPLWVENMAVAMPLGFPLVAQAKITLAELLDYPVFRWPAEACLLLDQRLSPFR
jgi:hypothetical protein